MINLIIAGVFTALFTNDARTLEARGAKVSALLVGGISALYYFLIFPQVFGSFPALGFTLGFGERYGLEAKTVWLAGVLLPIFVYAFIAYRLRKKLSVKLIN